MIEIIAFRKLVKNTLQGFVTVRMTKIGIEIRDITVHEKNGKRWLGMPAKPQIDKTGSPIKDSNGKSKYVFIIDFYEKSFKEKFQEAVLNELQKRGE